MDPAALELLLEADRAQHTMEVKKLLDEGTWVVSDRSYITGLAYAYACGNNISQIQEVMNFALHVMPDLVIVLDISYQDAVKRWTGKRTREEAKGESFYEIVRANLKNPQYGRLARPKFSVVLDSLSSVEDLHEEITSIVQEVF